MCASSARREGHGVLDNDRHTLTRGLLLVAVSLGLACSGPTNPIPPANQPSVIVSIDSTETYGDHSATVRVRFDYPVQPDSALGPLDGFNLLIAYDTTVLTFENTKQGDAIRDWDYWSWRVSHFDDGTGVPATGVTLIAIRDISRYGGVSDIVHPDGVIAELSFFVSRSADVAGGSTDLHFYLDGCNHNVITTRAEDATELYYADTTLGNPRIADSYRGTDCLQDAARHFSTGRESIEFRSGQVRLLELPNELSCDVNGDGHIGFGDFSIYFTQLYSENPPPDSLLGIGDCNNDGYPWTVADLVWILYVGNVGDPEQLQELLMQRPEPFSKTLNVVFEEADGGSYVSFSSDTYVRAIQMTIDAPEESSGSPFWRGSENISPSITTKDGQWSFLLYDFTHTAPPMPWTRALYLPGLTNGPEHVIHVEAATPPGALMKVELEDNTPPSF